MSDLNRWEMHGPVRTLRKEFAEWNPDLGEWQPQRGLTILTFRPDGQLSESEYHNPDRSVVRHTRVYTESGRLTEEQWWTNNVLTNRVVHTYDVDGRPASSMAVAILHSPPAASQAVEADIKATRRKPSMRAPGSWF